MANMDERQATPPSPTVAEKKADDTDVSSTLPGSDVETAVPPRAAWGSDAPDGGTAAWIVVFGAWCTSFCSFGWLNSVGVFQTYYEEELLKNYSSSTIAWIPSLQIFFMMGTGPFVGVIFDHYGPRHLLLVGTILHVLGIMTTSVGSEYWQILLAQGICSALGAACIFQPGISCAASWFSKNRGAALGVLFTGSSLGGIVFPIMVSRLISSVSFGWAMRICGFLILILLIIANLTVKSYQPSRPHPITAAQLIKPLKEVDFLLITAGFFCFSYGFFPPINYIELQAISAGMSSSLAQYLIPILNAGSLFGRLLAGIFGDKIGRYNIFVIVCYFSALWVLALWIPGMGTAAEIAFAVLFGFFSGAYVSLITPLVLAISPFQELGFRTGIVTFAAAIAGLTANPITGALLEGSSGWLGLKIWSGIFCAAGSTFVLIARIRRTGWKLAVIF